MIEIEFSEYYLSGYAIYSNQQLQKILLINHEPYLSTLGGIGDRPAFAISIDLGGNGGNEEVGVKELYLPFADVQTGLKWAGQCFDEGVPVGVVEVKKQSVKEPVVVQASSAVLVEF